MIVSPVTQSKNIAFQQSISCQEIIDNYKKSFNIDISKYFDGLDDIKIYKCLDTGYRFFYPFNIAGDSSFYEALQQFEWYYMPWKWEHEIACKYLKKDMKILEIGCANGEFLKKIKNFVSESVGLELNEKAVENGKKEGLNILNETVQLHSERNMEQYDLICSFQVLEHIIDIKSFIESSLKLLKKDGLMIVCVPNNDSFLGKGLFYLNMPPHHMGLWNEVSLKKLSKFFNISSKKNHLEPLQEYHYDLYRIVMENKYLNNRFLNFLYYRLNLRNNFQQIIKRRSSKITGHSILSVFQKK